MNLSKPFGLDCIPVVVLKNCEPGLSFILAEPFNKCIVFQFVRRFNQWSLYLRMLGKVLQLKKAILLVFFFWSVKSLNNLSIIGLLIT